MSKIDKLIRLIVTTTSCTLPTFFIPNMFKKRITSKKKSATYLVKPSLILTKTVK